MTARTEAVAWMLRFLQDGYRITGDVDWSRNHPSIDVTRDGRRYHFTVNPKDTRFNLKRQDIIRRLGPPP